VDVVVAVLLISALLFAVGVSEPIATKMKLPHSVALAVLGITISAFCSLAGLFDDGFYDLNIISSQSFLYVFLPILLFQVALTVNFRRLVDDWVPIFVMAVLAVFIVTFMVGYVLFWVSGISLAVCLLIGSIISTTDPSAVVSLFKSFSAPKRLANIIEGESLLNDAAAIALFGIFTTLVINMSSEIELLDVFKSFPFLVFGGLLTGWIVGRLLSSLIIIFDGFKHAQITISLALPYFVYVVTETIIGASGVIAVVTAGVTLNMVGQRSIHPKTWSSLKELWGVLAYWSNSLIILLATFFVPIFLYSATWSDAVLIGLVVVVAFIARIMTLFLLLPGLSALKMSPVVGHDFKCAILWGGLRGAVTLALVLSVVENPQISEEVKRTVGILATGFTLFTLIFQGTTLRKAIDILGLTKLNHLDNALSKQVIAVSLQSVREDVEDLTSRYDLSSSIVRQEAKSFGLRLQTSVQEAEDCVALKDKEKITLGLISLAASEKQVILKLISKGIISKRISHTMILNSDRLFEASRLGRSVYNKSCRDALSYSYLFKFSIFLRRTFRMKFLLSVMIAKRFEHLLALKLISKELDDFAVFKIRRIYGRRVTELLQALLIRRFSHVKSAIEGLALQYPGYLELLEAEMIQRVSIRNEERALNGLFNDSLIGEELHSNLKNSIQIKKDIGYNNRPSLDVTVTKDRLIRQIPQFSELSDKALQILCTSLRSIHLNEGEFIKGFSRKSEASKQKEIYFVASGALELATVKDPVRLGRGEIFGSKRIFPSRVSYLSGHAITPTTLLVLSVPDAKNNKKIKNNKELDESLTAVLDRIIS
jgi:CPA1 family monovalent cation:H+ antiporter